MKPSVALCARVCAAVLAVALLGQPLIARAQEAPIKIATIPIDTGAEAFYALDQGFYKKDGLDASIERITNGPAITAAVVAGAGDIGFSDLLPLSHSRHIGVP